ncbi:DUF2690 domain-containing protein [Streptomyces sp. NPDC091292]|uniref:DUF2690 domain-containing protein n=1 Tax=Streptomyces sp. NPDC091292 TaxID=3365991 RepID=UPI0037F31A59
MRAKRHLIGGVAALLLALSTSQFAAAPSASAAECWRATCTGKDPYTMGCDDDAEVLDQVNSGNDIEVKLVWSPYCQAAWAKVTIDPGYAEKVYAALWYTPTLGGIEKPYPTTSVTKDNPTGYSAMGNWKATNKACWNIQGDDWDPAPLVYEQGGHAIPQPLVNGTCTDWI